KNMIGPDLDIPAPDVGTNGAIMALMYRQYSDGERERHNMRGVVTGKDVRIGGSEGRVKATGQGVIFCVEDYYAAHGDTITGESYMTQGFGNVGSSAARILHRLGAKLLSVNAADDTIYNPEGLEVPALGEDTRAPDNFKCSVLGFSGGQV